VSSTRFLDALTNSEREMRAITRWWSDRNDVLVTPTLRQPAWPLGQRGDAADSGVFTPPFSFTGQPAMSLPLYQSEGGLPVGLQFVGAYAREDVLLRLAAQLEEALPWADRWPSLAGAD
jgi:amidase